MTNKFKYIIVGQGLAGTCLALELLKREQSVLIIDKKQSDSSSRVAAGLYNPVTGRKMVLTWKALELFSFLKDFYRNAESSFATNFLHETTIYRPFVSLEEQNEWMGKNSLEDYKLFIDKVHTSSKHGNHLNDPFGGLMLKNCGYLDIPVFLDAARTLFKEKEVLVDDHFEIDQLKVEEEVTYKDYKSDKLIFCTGPDAIDTSLFNWLPFSPVKGEIIEIEPEEKFDIIYNRGVFIMPRINRKYVVGATYDTKDGTKDITEKARNTLIDKLKLIFKLSYSVKGQRAGIRPATKDRRPFVGMHPEMKQIGIFNGLGTKGVTLAPFFASQFVDQLVNDKDVDIEANISRYYSLYYQ